MIRNALTVLLALALAGCGFHLRDSLALPEDTPPVQVVSTTPFSELATILERNLRNAGAPVVTREQVQANPGMAVARLDIVSERWGDLPIAIDDQGRAQEFSLRYAAIFAFRLADGTDLVPQQAVELSRDYLAPAVDSIGKASERELLVRELRRDMAAAILRRVDAASKPAAAAQ